MRTAACLQHHPAPRLRGKEWQQLCSTDLLAQHATAQRICTVRLKNMLGDVQPDDANL